MNNYRLLAALLRHLTALVPLATNALLLNLALMVLGLAQSPTVISQRWRPSCPSRASARISSNACVAGSNHLLFPGSATIVPWPASSSPTGRALNWPW